MHLFDEYLFLNAGFLVVCYVAFVLCMFVDWLVLFQNPIFQNVSNVINTRSKKDILRPFHRDVLQLKIRWHTVYCVCYWRLFAQVGTYQPPGLHEWAIIMLIIHRRKLETNTKTALPAHVSRSPDWHWHPIIFPTSSAHKQTADPANSKRSVCRCIWENRTHMDALRDNNKTCINSGSHRVDLITKVHTQT